MFKVLTCNECGASKALPFTFEFTWNSVMCGKCADVKERKWSFHFCSYEHFVSWFMKHAEKGVPCRDCESVEGKPTGKAYGILSNPTCDICRGKLYIKNQIEEGFPWSGKSRPASESP